MYSCVYVNRYIFKACSYHLKKPFTPNRFVRSLPKRFRDSTRSVKGKVVTESLTRYDSDFEFNNINSIKDLKRVVKKAFVDSEEMDTEAEFFEKDHSHVLQNADKFYDMSLCERKRFRSMVKKQIIQKKYFKVPPETNLLTFAAKSQIRYLNEKNCHEWTPERLLECFPVTIDGIKKILKFPYAVNENFIRTHDAEVENNWELLESGEGKKLSSVTFRLYNEGKLTRENYAGNFNLPFPPLETKKLPTKKLGEFMSIIKPYLDAKRNKEKSVAVYSNNKSNDMVKNSANNHLVEHQNLTVNITKGPLPNLKYRYPSRSEIEDPESASFLAAEETNEDEAELPCSHFEENLLQEFAEKKRKNTVDFAYENWLKNQAFDKKQYINNSMSIDSRSIKKGEFEIIKKYTDYRNEVDYDPYLYKESIHSQHVPARDPVKRKIKIPKHVEKAGTLYRVGNCFYDKDGYFLYKLCA